MINIFVTYRCNLSCPYCFAHDLQQEYRQDLQPEEFDKLLKWMTATRVTAVAFIGGEPTLHPKIVEMVRATAEAGITVTMFTNGLFPRELVAGLTPYVANFVINYNSPEIYGAAGLIARLEENLIALRDAGARLTFSKNFSPEYSDYEYLIEGAVKYGVGAIRYDISRPGPSAKNDYFSVDATKALMSHIVSFVRLCEEQGIKTGLDCCLKLCELSREERAYLERVSMKLTGICHPSVDVHPDLSASYCLPMRHITVDDVTTFSSSERLIHHFASAVRQMRFEGADEDCRSCPDFRRRCQGGCLALKETKPLKNQPSSQEKR